MGLDPQTRADLANQVLKNIMFEEGFKILEQHYMAQMASTAPNEVEERNKWHICNFVLNDVKTALTAIIQNGTIELHNAKSRERMKNDGSGNRPRDKQQRNSAAKKA